MPDTHTEWSLADIAETIVASNIAASTALAELTEIVRLAAQIKKLGGASTVINIHNRPDLVRAALSNQMVERLDFESGGALYTSVTVGPVTLFCERLP